MKRLILIFLLALLPLHMSWAAVGSYCQHENGKAAQHFGHHEHKHQAQADDTPQTKSLLTVDADCGVCQLSSVGIPAMPAEVLQIDFHQAVTAFAEFDFLTSFRPERPERPKWVRAV